jgi:hypothetical protein
LTLTENLKIPKINFGTNGELIITASSTSSSHDFDFFEGKWKLEIPRKVTTNFRIKVTT